MRVDEVDQRPPRAPDAKPSRLKSFFGVVSRTQNNRFVAIYTQTRGNCEVVNDGERQDNAIYGICLDGKIISGSFDFIMLSNGANLK